MDENNYNNILFFLAGAIFSPSQEVYTVWHEKFSDDVLLRDAFKASDSLLLLPRPLGVQFSRPTNNQSTTTSFGIPIYRWYHLIF